MFPRSTGLGVFWLLILTLIGLAPSLVLAADSTATWVAGLDTSYVLDLTYPLCPNATGNTTFSATVIGLPSGSTVIDANVFATIRKPDSSSSDVNFTNDLSGVYTLSYNFDQNGTYFIQAHAYKAPTTKGDVNAYAYLGALDWNVSFVNNAFSIGIGELGTIRNTVTNADGNAVYDVNANTTLYYPAGTAADANTAMSQLSGGEFVYSFFGPTPAGAYTVSSLFQCGNRYAHNGTGTFTVTAPPDTGTGGSSGDSGGSGGGGGGAGGGGGKSAQIVSIEFEPELGKGAPSQMYVTVQNLGTQIRDFLVEYLLTSPSGSTYQNTKIILAVSSYQLTTVIAENAFTPIETGNYTLSAKLKSLNGVVTYDTHEQTYDVKGTHSIVMDVLPSSNKTAVGLSYPFLINLFNAGDFDEENIQIEWYLVDPNGDEYLRSTFNTSMFTQETRSLSYSPFIPLSSLLGTHELVVHLLAYGVTQTQNVMFNVSSPDDYYAQLIADLELRVEQLDDKIDDLQQRGFDVTDVSLTLLDIQLDLSRAKGMLLAGKLEELNPVLLDLSARVTRLGALLDSLEQQSPLLSREGLNMILYIGAALLLALFVWLLFWFLDKEKKERQRRKGEGMLPASPSWLNSLLFVEKSYYSLEERERLKRKPLIGTLVGMMEGET